MVHASVLEDRTVLAVGGAGARDFLQGLITNDISACTAGHAIYAALLTPQGKILHDFFIVPDASDRLLIDCAASHATDLMRRLMLYRLRAKVEISARPELAVTAIWGGGAAAELPLEIIAFADPRHPTLGLRVLGARDVLARATAGFLGGDYLTHRLALGIPDSTDVPPDTVFALDAGLEELNGVSFKKGCYIGQEVTARMKHRASARRRFVLAQFSGEAPPPGTPIQAQERELGTIASGRGEVALALVRLDRLAEAEEQGAAVRADGREVHLKKPGWFRG
jgi:folate-binding protein YgfZ